MSMIGNLVRLPEEVRAKLHQSPALITGLLYPDATVPAEADTPGLFDRLFGKKVLKNAAPADPTIAPLKKHDQLDIDKSWHALHYLFAGGAWEGEFPQGFLVAAGTPVGEIDVGYGPARSYTPAEVQQIANFLESLDELALKKRMNLEEMAKLEIYPSFGTTGADVEEEWEYVASYFRALKQFVRATATAAQAMLVYIN